MQAGGSQCLVQLGTVRTFAGFHFGKLGHDPPVAAVEIVGDRLLLRLKTEPALALPAGGNPVISHEPAGMLHVTTPPTFVDSVVTGIERWGERQYVSQNVAAMPTWLPARPVQGTARRYA